MKPRTDSTNENLEEQDGIKPSKWLNVYLDEISLVLRQGGWREDDINDMIVSESPSKRWNQQHDSEVRDRCVMPRLCLAFTLSAPVCCHWPPCTVCQDFMRNMSLLLNLLLLFPILFVYGGVRLGCALPEGYLKMTSKTSN